MRQFKPIKRAIKEPARKKPDPFYPVIPQGAYSIKELMKFFSIEERRWHMFSRQLGNFRCRKRGHKNRRIIDWRS